MLAVVVVLVEAAGYVEASAAAAHRMVDVVAGLVVVGPEVEVETPDTVDVGLGWAGERDADVAQVVRLV